MYDIEVDIFDKVARAVTTVYPNIECLNEYQRIVRAFPCLMLYEADSFIEEMNGSNAETATAVMYELQVTTNSNNKKGDCKTIAALADSVLTISGFKRISLMPVQNLEDATAYRIVGRYTAAVSDNKIYRR